MDNESLKNKKNGGELQMTINISLQDVGNNLHPKITVLGVGGSGGNAVNNMINANLEGVDFLIANTDAQALQISNCDKKIQLGIQSTRGLGAGMRPDVGKQAAEETLTEISEMLESSHMLFIAAGMGGGTGTGAAPVIAKLAREKGILTVGVVTKPFHFEGSQRMKLAEKGLEELQQYVDTLLTIPNQNLFRIANEKTTFADAFKMADDVLYSGVRGVTDLMVMPGLINLDFADIRSIMSEMGKAMMGTGEAEGDRRAIEAAEAAIANPLLDDTSMKGARGVLINITAGKDITLFEVDEAANRISDEVAGDANIIFGSTFEEGLDGRVRVSVVATGIESDQEVSWDPKGVDEVNLVNRENGAREDGAEVLSKRESEVELRDPQLDSINSAIESPEVKAAGDSQTDLIDHIDETKTSMVTEKQSIETKRERSEESAPYTVSAQTKTTTVNTNLSATRDIESSEIERPKSAKSIMDIVLPRLVRNNKVEAAQEEPSVKSESHNELNSDNNLNQSDISQISKTPELSGAGKVDENDNRIQDTMENSHEEEIKNDRKTLQEANQVTKEVNEGQVTNTIFDGVEDDNNIIDSDEDEDLLEIPAFLRRQAN